MKSITLLISTLFSTTLIIACGVKAPSPRYAVAFYTEADPSESLAGVEVLANGQTVGTSDDTGLVQAILEGREGTPFTISWNCPEGHRASATAKTLRLRSFQGLSPDASTGLTMTLGCPPNTRHVGFIARTGHAGLALKVNGTEVARTNLEGIAHFTTEGAPGVAYQVQIDTSDNANLRPESPSRTFSLGDADEVFVFDQNFETRNSSGRRGSRRGVRRRSGPRHSGPRRSGSHMRARHGGPQKIRRVPIVRQF